MKRSRLDGSVCGAVLNRQATNLTSVHRARRSFCTTSAAEALGQAAAPPTSCAKSSLWISSTFMLATETRRVSHALQPGFRRQRYSSAAVSTARKSSLPYSLLQPSGEHDKMHLMSFVDARGEGTVQEHLDFHRDPYRRGYAQPEPPKLQVSEKRHNIEYPKREETLKTCPESQDVIARLCSAIAQRLRHPNRASLDAIYRLYTRLPEPRMLFLPWAWRNRLLKVMGTPFRRDTESMLRYFALVADVKNAGLTLRRTQWNFALAFATKYTARATNQEMKSALRLWREMEKEANVMGNDVTFNVLFDVAAKSGHFTLAEMIYKEMETRGIGFTRFHHVSLIHYFGLKLDSGGIRAAYKEMVDAGEMIDPVVLNCVISGLLRCGEEDAAEYTYQKMRNSHASVPDMPRRDYMMKKVVTKVLMFFAKVGKQHPQLKDSLQMSVQRAPDLHTYTLLVQHYAIRAGNLAKVAQYLDEMKHLKISVHPTLFLALFKGFHLHGGYAGSEWSEKRLRGVLAALYQAKDGNGKAFRIETWVVIWALRAVKKCSSPDAVLETFDELSQRWEIKGERLQFIHAILDKIVQSKDMKWSRRRQAR